MRNVRCLVAEGAGITACCAVLLGTWSCDDNSLDRVRKANTLRMGYAVEAPYALVAADGEVTGESPETALDLAARLGVRHVEWVQTPFSLLIPDLLDRRFDLIAAGLFVTPERAKLVRFSRPTVRVCPGLLVRKGNPRGVPDFEEIDPRSGIKVAVLAGSVEHTRLRARGFQQAALTLVPDAQAGRAAVTQELVDALAISLPTARWMADATPALLQALSSARSAARVDMGSGGARRGGEERTRSDLVAFAFHPEDVSLARAWDAAQQEYLGSPEHLEILSRFGFEAPDAAVGASAQSVPK